MTDRKLSAHFDTSEFRCHHCGQLVVPPDALVRVLERLRAWTGSGGPLRIVSGYRCTWWNRHVGGAPASRHRHGDAVDIAGGRVTREDARGAGATGIGYDDHGWVVHVDVRPGAVVEFADPPKPKQH